jgi:glycine cleavage system aminomethyltransferase T
MVCFGTGPKSRACTVRALADCVLLQDGIVSSYGEDNDRRAAEAWQHGVVLVDRSHCGRLRLAGGDRLNFLHGQSTADINRLKPGQLCDTVRYPDNGVI